MGRIAVDERGHVYLADYASDDDDGGEAKARAFRETELAARLGQRLEQWFPGHFFPVCVDQTAGFIRITHSFLPPTWAYNVRLDRLASELEWGTKGKVYAACAELLERFLQPRGRYDRDLFRQGLVEHRRMMRGLKLVETDGAGKRRIVTPTELV